jgi:cyclophilin family peptidyl-prolyl cis-trans isomerase
MLDRTWGGGFRRSREGQGQGRGPSKVARRPWVEGLEGRQLLAASLAPIADVSVPSTTGYQVSLDGSGSGSPIQSYAVQSSNPDIKVSVAQGPYVTVNVSHDSSGPGDPAFTGAFTYQKFEDLTPNTADRIDSFTNAGGYDGNQIYRIVGNFSGQGGPTDFVIQGGPKTSLNNPLEVKQQLAFNQPGAVAIANANPSTAPNGATDGDDFFITTGPQPSLNYKYSIFGQIVSGDDTLAKLTGVATQDNGSGEKSSPITPVTITSATTSDVNPNGVIHVDATGATPGETAVVTVTAYDPTTSTSTTQTFNVTVTTDTNTANNPNTLTFKPLAFPVTASTGPSQPVSVQLSATNNNPNNTAVTTQYALLTAPQHGTITDFNNATGSFTYTPEPGFTGSDTFTYTAANVGGSPSPLLGNTNTVTVNVGSGAVRQIGSVLVVTPLPRTDGGTNTIVVKEVANPTDPTQGNVLQVTINGEVDSTQPFSLSISRVVVYGSKASDNVTVDPSVDPAIAVTLDGGRGHGRRNLNVLQAGAGSTREHGWYAHNILVGGSGPNQLIGRAGRVRFVPTDTSNEIFAGEPHPGYSNFHSYNGRTKVRIQAPGGTFFRFKNGKLHPIPTPPAQQIRQS